MQVLDYGRSGDPRFLTTDGRSTFLLVFAPPAEGLSALDETFDTTLAAAAQQQDLEASVTGYQQLLVNDSSTDEGAGVLVETLIGGIGALVVLLFVFASFLAFVPLLIATVSILSTFLAVLALTTVTEVSGVVQFLIALVGLGVAIDYSLLVVTRWRRNARTVRATTTL